MSRNTYSLSAVAIAATASLSFSSADSAEAFAQDGLSTPVIEDAASEAADKDATLSGVETFETVPLPAAEIIADDAASDSVEPQFVSEAVVQPIPEEPEVVPQSAASLRELVGTVAPGDMTEQMRCLAGAVYFEARGEPLAGQLAVAQVVINRSEDRRFPASYCGVVYQRAQFSFVKNGRMPRIREGSGAWNRAKAIARIAHDGLWESEAADAVYFHATYVRPRWSYRKQRTAKIDTHIFYR